MQNREKWKITRPTKTRNWQTKDRRQNTLAEASPIVSHGNTTRQTQPAKQTPRGASISHFCNTSAKAHAAMINVDETWCCWIIVHRWSTRVKNVFSKINSEIWTQQPLSQNHTRTQEHFWNTSALSAKEHSVMQRCRWNMMLSRSQYIDDPKMLETFSRTSIPRFDRNSPCLEIVMGSHRTSEALLRRCIPPC